MLKIQVKDFGPIGEGIVELRPLTVFVGPNNAGKSYMAMLIYSILHAGSPRFGKPMSAPASASNLESAFRVPAPWELFSQLKTEEILLHSEELVHWGLLLTDSPSEHSRLLFADLPPFLRKTLESSLREISDLYLDDLASELNRCFSTEIEQLRRRLDKAQPFHISVAQSDLMWRFTLVSKARNQVDRSSEVDASHLVILPLTGRRPPYDLRQALLMLRDVPNVPPVFFDVLRSRLGEIGTEFLQAFYGKFSSPAYYLPASRDGILQSHKAIASVAIQRSSLIGIEPLQIDRLTGVVTDFISLLLLMKGSGEGELSDVAAFLEEKALAGTISLESESLGYPEIYYRSATGQFPIYRTSSMITELAPFVLLLKYALRTGDTLIIEEPESHLHPTLQRVMARAIVKLVRKGVRVVVTTHSDFLLGELNNCIGLAGLGPEHTAARADDVGVSLGSDEVAAYLFSALSFSRGTRIKALEVDPIEGISDEVFLNVTESLYNDTLELQQALLGTT